MDSEVVICRCAGTTRRSISRRNAHGDTVSCWLRLDERGDLHPGCWPDERTSEVLERRAARARGECDRVTLIRRFPRSAIIDCQCGRRTVVNSARFLPVDLVPHPAPPDPRVPFYAPACWLSQDSDGTTAPGCQPDIHAWEVVARARKRRGLSAHPDQPREDVPELLVAAISMARQPKCAPADLQSDAGATDTPAPAKSDASTESIPQLAFF